ncbi:hypothetical protein [Porphyromonas catoniae]|uniref:hypothetical protein n=1 Tax=Porphyromonas catoniae TaxID=41976 RepID=UPI0028D8FAB9|nr:hypothetical protein [Porphyromonas catoniae]
MNRLRKVKRLVTLRGLTQRLKRSKRLIINRRGDGVHSPYAYHFITRVVRNVRPYYCFTELREALRQARELSEGKPPRPIRKARTLELIFRIAHELQARHVLLLTGETSFVPRYLIATGSVEQVIERQHIPALSEVSTASLVVVERIPLDDRERSQLSSLLKDLAKRKEASVVGTERMTALVSTRSRTAKRLARSLRGEAKPQLVIDLIDIEVWFFDARLTPSIYKSVY